MKGTFVVIVAVLASVALSTDCGSKRIDRSRAKTNKYTVTYDLTPLVSDSQWVVKEKDLVARNYSYEFNLCKGVKYPPVYGGTVSACKNKTDTELYPAYQLDRYNGCVNLGYGTDPDHMRWSPIDYDDPTTGVVVQYTGGSDYMCNGRERSLRLSFFCMNNPHTLPSETSVVEYPMCTYNIEMQTQFACPISCGEYNRKLCGGRGICGYDRDKQTAHCFCNDGYYGTACEKDGTGLSELSSSSYILMCVCGFLLIVEIGVLIMWKKVKGLRLDPAAYANLNKENMGMISNMA